MTHDDMDKEIEEFKEYCRKELPILQEQERSFDRSSIKTLDDSKKYWRLRTKIMIFNDTISERKYYPAEYYRDCMMLAVECLKHSKTVSKELQAYWYERWADCNLDFVGEAHCKVGTKYYPAYETLAVGEEKTIWEEVIELGDQYYGLNPKT